MLPCHWALQERQELWHLSDASVRTRSVPKEPRERGENQTAQPRFPERLPAQDGTAGLRSGDTRDPAKAESREALGKGVLGRRRRARLRLRITSVWKDTAFHHRLTEAASHLIASIKYN